MTAENIAYRLDLMAQQIPQNLALVVPRKKDVLKITFDELARESSSIASGLEHSGFKKGQRVLLMVPPGIEFVSLTFALFKIGALPVLIDPGLGKDNILKCVDSVSPEALIGPPKAWLAKLIYRKSFRSVDQFVVVGMRNFWFGKTYKNIQATGDKGFRLKRLKAEDPAAILFTSGSTGPPKGVVYTHFMFNHQVQTLKAAFRFQPGEVDLPTFPLFALFSLALGMTCVIPEMDSTCPAKVNPKNILDPMAKYGVNSAFGSPALWDVVSRYCLERKKVFPAVKRILMAGAPISGSLLRRFEDISEPGTEIFTPYGATEALPVAVAERREILEDTWENTCCGNGICVGKPVTGITVKIIHITDDSLKYWRDELERPEGKIGEIVVKGPWVTRQYFNNELATTLAKIKDGEDFWHRMGDVGYIDEKGRLWFCGRKSQRVITAKRTFYTICCEGIFNCHPQVRRTALVGIGPKGNQTPIIIIEAEPGKHPRTEDEYRRFVAELLKLAENSPINRDIKHVMFNLSFPVDIRHNAKIFREKLAVWAHERIMHQKDNLFIKSLKNLDR